MSGKHQLEDAELQAAKRQKGEDAREMLGSRAYPPDWPARGSIPDLSVQDLPHQHSSTEWWYYNSHLKDVATGQEYSVFAAFFRTPGQYNWEENKYEVAYALNWSIVDVSNSGYHPHTFLDPKTPEIVLEHLDSSKSSDSRLKVAMREMLERGSIPLPDKGLKNPICASDKLHLDYDGQTVTKSPEGNYHVKVHEDDEGFELVFKPKKNVCLQGHGGVTKVGRDGDEMFYYFIPRNDVHGKITLGGKTFEVAGSGWYDHEFGGTDPAELEPPKKKSENAMDVDSEEKEKEGNVSVAHAWNWMSLQLDDGTDITATHLADHNAGDKTIDQYAIVVLADGSQQDYYEIGYTGSEPWVSSRTYQSYPQHWEIVIPGADIHLHIDSIFGDQELQTLISSPAFWEGRLHIKGTHKGKPVTGIGFLERHGFSNMKNLDVFFKSVSAEVIKQIDLIIPHEPSMDTIMDLIAGPGLEHYSDGVSVEVFKKTIVEPLRSIIDRGGKAWRSYACLVCIDCVGGDSRQFVNWLAMPEMMHVGSLIVDDIQDKSDVRRGGPSAHKVYGDAIAINAGNAAYFLGESMISRSNVSAETKARLYHLYFQTLRAGHVGQGMDIFGQHHLMPVAVESGDGSEVVRSVIAVHRLKSASPAGTLAKMGAIIGGGKDDQIEKLGAFFEALGVAFQIMDDVLNLRGMVDNKKGKKVNLKDLGEDIREGKVTFPVAMSISRLDAAKRKWMWDTVSSKPQDQAVVNEVIALLEECGGLQASVDYATKIVDDAWDVLSQVLPDSFYKAMLRAFSFFVLQRHY